MRLSIVGLVIMFACVPTAAAKYLPLPTSGGDCIGISMEPGIYYSIEDCKNQIPPFEAFGMNTIPTAS